MTNLRITATQARKAGLGPRFGVKTKSGKRKKKPKYGNKRVTNQFGTFDSLKEYRHFLKLKMREEAGEIRDLQHHVVFELAPKIKYSDAERATPALRYEADFSYWIGTEYIVEDVKSEITRENTVYKMKRHLMLVVHGIEVKEI
ncbi:hypothetical protein J559_3078 [Acinetobacter sp. 983759]|uniref:DUF1064 domain-containing protein n=1 Tax=Acinetobacter TaxID=469 RepID=UPI000449B2C7|nr:MULTISPECIES: DUF1064 domain-containing protein [Acinetobacter]EXE12601.1 hypothetical protein J559_3078 [Acinetobacter sp. 983759]